MLIAKIFTIMTRIYTEKSRECHNYKPQRFPDTKRKSKQAQIEQTYEKH